MMAFNDLFKVYPNRNPELRATAKQMYEFGRNIAQEPSAGRSAGLDEHSIKRQEVYVKRAKDRLEAMKESPRPDQPATHPTNLDIDFTVEYEHFTVATDGAKIPINEDTQLISELWMICASELAKSATASDAGSIYGPDFRRAIGKVDAIAKYVAECASRLEDEEELDLPETQSPGALLEVPTRGNSNR